MTPYSAGQKLCTFDGDDEQGDDIGGDVEAGSEFNVTSERLMEDSIHDNAENILRYHSDGKEDLDTKPEGVCSESLLNTHCTFPENQNLEKKM